MKLYLVHCGYYDLEVGEGALYADWMEQKFFAAGERAGSGAVPKRSRKRNYCIVMPPLNVTGSLHMGHALNHTLRIF